MSESGTAFGGRRFIWRWVLACILVAGGAYWWWTSSKGSVDAPAAGAGALWGSKVPVRTVTAVDDFIDETLTAIGTVVPLSTVALRSQVDGELVKILFHDGQEVSQGDLLAQIDPRSYQVQVDQAKAQLLQSQAQLKGAQAELQRHKILFQQKSIALQALETKETSVQQLSAQIKANQAELARAQLQLDHTQIIAPISGRLGLRRLDQGNVISAANTDGLVTLTQIAPIAVEFALPQTQLAELSRARRASEAPLPVVLSDRQGKALTQNGVLQAMDNQIDVATGTLRIKAHFENQDHALFPNQFVNVRVILGRERGVLIPSFAVQRGSLGTFVYVVDEQSKVRVQQVELGIASSEQTQVVQGLTAGERIVVDGVDRLREGTAVDVIEHDGQLLSDIAEGQESKKPLSQGAKRSGRGTRMGP